MLRGFKRGIDVLGTAISTDARGLFFYWFPTDKRSFVSQPKIINGECSEPRPHLIAYGQDKGPIRAEIFRRNREANGGINRCWKCGRQVYEQKEDANCRENVGQWHHLRNKPGTRCDCPENGVVSCSGDCHKEEHPQPQFGKREVHA